MKLAKHITLSLLLVQAPFLCFSQLVPNQLWYAEYVYDFESKDKDKNVQSFLSMENDSLIHLIFFKEFLKKETGEIEIYPIWDTLSIQYRKPLGTDVLLEGGGEVQFEIISESDSLLILVDGNYGLAYRKVAEEQNFYTKEDLSQFMVGNDFEVIENAYNVPNERKVRVLDEKHWLLWRDEEERGKLYFREGMPLYTQYLITEFNGYLLLKGITSYPKILLSIEDTVLRFVTYDTNKPERKVLFWRKIK